VEQLSGMDAAFVYAETAGPAHVTFFGIYAKIPRNELRARGGGDGT
jgi:hypothetical protein